MAFVKADAAQYACKIAGQTFQVLNIDVHEEMSDLFRIGLNLWLDDPEVAIQPMLRQPAEITITWEQKEKKYFGIVEYDTGVSLLRAWCARTVSFGLVSRLVLLPSRYSVCVPPESMIQPT